MIDLMPGRDRWSVRNISQKSAPSGWDFCDLYPLKTHEPNAPKTGLRCLKFRTVAYDSTPFHSDAQPISGHFPIWRLATRLLGLGL
jgi:hypothetical protein